MKKNVINIIKGLILVFDIDGTIIPSSTNYINTKTLNLLYILSKNNTIILASARPLLGIITLFPKRYFDNFNYISLNGAYSFINNFENIEKSLSINDVSYLIENYKNNNLWLFSKDKWYCSDINSVEYEKEVKAVNFEAIQLTEFNNREVILKAVIIDSYSNIDLLELEKRFNIYKSNPKYIEIMSKGVHKGTYLKKIANKKIICSFGNGENDIPLFNNSTYSIAMSTSNEKTKKSADFVTSNISHKGILEGLDFLINKLYKNG